MFDSNLIEKIAPDCWFNSQLSIARHYGSAIINGKKYMVDPEDNYLVREDIYKSEMKDKAKAERVAKAEKKKWNEIAQSGLFGSHNAVHN